MRILYVVGNFPSTSETFIRDELLFHQNTGLDVSIASLGARPANHMWDPISAPLQQCSFYSRPRGRRQALAALAGRCMVAIVSARARQELSTFALGPDFRAAGRLSAYYLWQILKDQPCYDIVHCHFGTAGLAAARLRALGLLNAKLVTTFHGVDMSSNIKAFGANAYLQLFNEGDLFLPVSKEWQSKLTALGCPPEKTFLHRMGVDCESIQAHAHRAPPPKTMRLITIGRLVEKKGHEVLLASLADLKHRRPDMSWTLQIVGDGPLRKRLVQYVGKLQLQELVMFHGTLEHHAAMSLLQAASVFVLPSVTARNGDMEGIPVSLMEAMASGKPVVSTLHSGIPELVDHGISGLLCPEHDVRQLSYSLEALADAPQRWAAMGSAGRKRVETDFNLTSWCYALQRHYRRLALDGDSAA